MGTAKNGLHEIAYKSMSSTDGVILYDPSTAGGSDGSKI